MKRRESTITWPEAILVLGLAVIAKSILFRRMDMKENKPNERD